jgi:hypothetical protein
METSDCLISLLPSVARYLIIYVRLHQDNRNATAWGTGFAVRGIKRAQTNAIRGEIA